LGFKKEKNTCIVYVFFFTLLGSLFMLMGIIWLYLYTGNMNIQLLKQMILERDHQIFLWCLFFVAFAVKIPIYPVYTWLPEAHVEAPTGGSIILAGVLLKLGLYGLIRIIIPLFPFGNMYYSPLVMTIAFVSIIYVSFITILQIDLKKIIAYSSIIHMNFSVLGLFSNNIYGIEGCIFSMLSHGLISSMLFYCIGILYDRFKVRNILYYALITQIMPLFSFYFFFAIISNMGVPGTSSFIGEFLLLLSLSYRSVALLLIIAFSLFLSTIYNI